MGQLAFVPGSESGKEGGFTLITVDSDADASEWLRRALSVCPSTAFGLCRGFLAVLLTDLRFLFQGHGCLRIERLVSVPGPTLETV